MRWPAALHEGSMGEDDVFAEVELEIELAFRSWPLFRAVPAWAMKRRNMLNTCEGDDSESVRTRAPSSSTPSTSDDDDDYDEVSSVGSTCRQRIETDYSPSYMYDDRKLAFFPVPPAATQSPMVAISTMFAPIPCGLQVMMPASVYAASMPSCAATGGPAMTLQLESTSFNSRTPLRAAEAPGTNALDRAIASLPDFADDTTNNRKTSVLLQNLPCGLTRTMLMSVLRGQGLARHVDFMYVPADLRNMANYGYAILNLSTPEAAEECMEKLGGFSDWGMPSASACEASWCTGHQGLHAYTERYRNSHIMHKTVDDEYKPAVFKNEVRIRFPRPTKPIRAPRPRKEECFC